MATKTDLLFKSSGLADKGKEMNHMQKYEAPEMEVVEFETEDVITTSGGIDEGEAGLEGLL